MLIILYVLNRLGLITDWQLLQLERLRAFPWGRAVLTPLTFVIAGLIVGGTPWEWQNPGGFWQWVSPRQWTIWILAGYDLAWLKDWLVLLGMVGATFNLFAFGREHGPAVLVGTAEVAAAAEIILGPGGVPVRGRRQPLRAAYEAERELLIKWLPFVYVWIVTVGCWALFAPAHRSWFALLAGTAIGLGIFAWRAHYEEPGRVVYTMTYVTMLASLFLVLLRAFMPENQEVANFARWATFGLVAFDPGSTANPMFSGWWRTHATVLMFIAYTAVGGLILRAELRSKLGATSGGKKEKSQLGRWVRGIVSLIIVIGSIAVFITWLAGGFRPATLMAKPSPRPEHVREVRLSLCQGDMQSDQLWFPVGTSVEVRYESGITGDKSVAHGMPKALASAVIRLNSAKGGFSRTFWPTVMRGDPEPARQLATFEANTTIQVSFVGGAEEHLRRSPRPTFVVRYWGEGGPVPMKPMGVCS